VLHAGDDPGRVSDDAVGQYTEVDTLAVRLPYSREEAGTTFPTQDKLIAGADGIFDIVIAEVKSGADASPNTSWYDESRVSNLDYILRFIGLFKDEAKITTAAVTLQKKYVLQEGMFRIRYIIFSQNVDERWSKKGVQYVTFNDCIQLIIDRGLCWAQAGIGLRSLHHQWDDVIKAVLKVANNRSIDAAARKARIWEVLDRGSARR
jgi:hypothetical protein